MKKQAEAEIAGGQTMDFVTMIGVAEILGVAAYAGAGALAAIHRKLDVLGVVCIGVVTAMGGGIIRDVFLGYFPPRFFENGFQVLAAAVTALAIFLLKYYHSRIAGKKLLTERIYYVLDTFGLGAFAVVGVNHALASEYGENGFLVITVGVLTCVGGGMLRDIFLGEIPAVFVKHVYALAAVAGTGLYYWLCRMELCQEISMIACMVTIGLLRGLAIHYRWNLPKIEV